MPRCSCTRSLVTLFAALMLLMGGTVSIAAQGDDATLDEATQPPDQESEPAYGLLQISAVACTGGEPGTVSILLATEYAPSGECVDGYAALLIDGADYGPAAPYLEVQLEAGVQRVALREVQVRRKEVEHGHAERLGQRDERGNGARVSSHGLDDQDRIAVHAPGGWCGASPAASSSRTGSRIVNCVPRPGSESSSILPPCPSTIRLTVGRPSPVPCFFVLK